jgi:hypothetical protein
LCFLSKFLHAAPIDMRQDEVGDIDAEKMEQEISAYVSALAAGSSNRGKTKTSGLCTLTRLNRRVTKGATY